MHTENLSLLLLKEKTPSTPVPTKSEKIKNALTAFVYYQSNTGNNVRFNVTLLTK